MTDKDKVIKSIECCLRPDNTNLCGECSYKDVPYNCKHTLIKDVYVLLKEQEAVEPILKREGRNKYYSYYVCPRCGDEVVYDTNYCSECGVRFLWEGR